MGLLVWRYLLKINRPHRVAGQEAELFLCRFHLRPAHVVNAGRFFVLGFFFGRLLALDHKADGHAGLNAKHVVLGAAEFGISAYITAQINHVNIGKLAGHGFAKPIKRAALNKAAVGHKCQHAVLVQPVAGPAKKARIHVVQLGFLCGALGDIGLLDARVDVCVFAVFVVVVFIRLIGVVRRIANHHADAPAVLALDAGDVLLAHSAKNIAGIALGGSVQADVVQRVDKAQIRKLGVVTGQRGVGGFDVQIGNVIRQDGDLVGV